MGLNKQQKDKFLMAHINHKYNLLHVVPSIGQPQLSGLYFKSFCNASKRNMLNLPEQIIGDGTKFCASCGNAFIGGINLKMRMQEKFDINNVETRTLRYTCLNCGYNKDFLIDKKQADSENDIKKPFVATWPASKNENTAVPQSDDGKVKKNSAKERAKKRKMSALSNMLLKKKESEQKRKKLSLSLDDILKQ